MLRYFKKKAKKSNKSQNKNFWKGNEDELEETEGSKHLSKRIGINTKGKMSSLGCLRQNL